MKTKRTLDFSNDQLDAIERINKWIDDSFADQTLTMGGYAGTGKTTIISHLVREWRNTSVVALAGKAANVLRGKGVHGAQTIHSLIYDPETDGSVTRFVLKPYLEKTERIIVDEASMVNTQLHNDILSFNLPVLYVGDHGQLEPIGDNPGLMKNPQIRLEKIHRQAAENPILRLAAAFREGRAVPNKWESKCESLKIGSRAKFFEIVKDTVDQWTQFICGYNATRHMVNAEVRHNIGFEETICEGDKIIFLRNNPEFEVFNGMQATVLHVYGEPTDTVDLLVETDDGCRRNVTCVSSQFGQDVFKEFRGNDFCLADYGYCLTAHKSQGSEFDRVVALEEIAGSWNAPRWRYTVATRAKNELVYCS